jgi:hypothetical protein
MGFREFLRFRHVPHEGQAVYATNRRAAIATAFTEYLEQGGIFEWHKPR